MSKKTTKVEPTVAEETVKQLNTAETLREEFEAHSNVSLRRLAIALDLNYQMMLKASKKPIAGELYDPSKVNYEEVARIIDRHEIDVSAIDFDALDTPIQRNGKLSKNFDDFSVGTKVWLRDSNEIPYEIIYKTDTHIVLELEGSTEPRVLSENTFFFKGPSFEPRTIVEEVVGE